MVPSVWKYIIRKTVLVCYSELIDTYFMYFQQVVWVLTSQLMAD